MTRGGSINNTHAQLACPRCDSLNTKFCYYNNYNFAQPRHYCKSCRRYWTHGGAIRDIPVGGGSRKSKRPRVASSPVFNTHFVAPSAAPSLPVGSFTSSLDAYRGLEDPCFGLSGGVSWAAGGPGRAGINHGSSNGGLLTMAGGIHERCDGFSSVNSGHLWQLDFEGRLPFDCDVSWADLPVSTLGNSLK